LIVFPFHSREVPYFSPEGLPLFFRPSLLQLPFGLRDENVQPGNVSEFPINTFKHGLASFIWRQVRRHGVERESINSCPFSLARRNQRRGENLQAKAAGESLKLGATHGAWDSVFVLIYTITLWMP